MGFGIFVHRADSIYDDSPAEQYQFPSQYLSRHSAFGGRLGRVLRTAQGAGHARLFRGGEGAEDHPGPEGAGMYLALMEPGTYLDFANPVPFEENGSWIEQGVLNEQGRISGRAQAAVRPLAPADFNRIIGRGLIEPQPLMQRTGDATPAEGSEAEILIVERDRVTFAASRIVRDRCSARSCYGLWRAVCGVGPEAYQWRRPRRGRSRPYSPGRGERPGCGQ